MLAEGYGRSLSKSKESPAGKQAKQAQLHGRLHLLHIDQDREALAHLGTVGRGRQEGQL